MTQYSGVFTLQQQGQALTSGQWCTDPYFKNTTLLLHADGVVGGAQNNTFLDSSTNAFAITRNGNTTQGSFTPYGPTWSNYLDGSSTTSIDVTANSAINDFGTGDFNIECWFFATSSNFSVEPTLISCVTTWSSSVAYQFEVRTGGVVRFFAGDSIPISLSSGATTVSVNTWNHVAASRSSGTTRLFVNGVVVDTTSTVVTISKPSQLVRIGAVSSGGAQVFTGYLSNIRIVKGQALYTSNFTVPTSTLTTTSQGATASNVSLLTCQTNRFVDSSTASPKTITISNAPSVQRFSPFAPQYQYTPDVIGGSGYFDGTGDELSTASGNTSLTFGTGAYTVEFWVYSNVSMTSYTANEGPVFIYCDATNGWGMWSQNAASNYLKVATRASGDVSLPSNYVLVANQWNHVVAVRSGTGSNQFAIFVNGTRVLNSTDSYNWSVSGSVKVGGISTSGYYVNGYIGSMRIVKGTAVYDPTVSTLTVPTAPLTAISGTSLLLNYTNAGIYDNAMMNDLETVGNAQVSTAVVKYGSGSLKFDGNGDALVGKNSSNYYFASGDFTIEFWFNTNTLAPTPPAPSVTGYAFILGQTNWNGSAGNGWCIFQYNQQIIFYAPGGTLANINAGNVITSVNAWYHIAIVRCGSAITIYINGTASASGTLTISNSSSPLMVGGISATYGWDNEYIVNGYIDDFRITKGVARYTANFQPPKVAFANQ